MKLEGKVAIVTGAGQGIGRAIALLLAKEGAKVVVNDVNLEAASKVVGEIQAIGRQAKAIKADVTNSREVNQMVKQTVADFKKIDILVNNAGVAVETPIVDLPESEWDRQIDIDLKGVFLCSQAVAKEMIKQEQGKIVSIASLAGHSGQGIPKLGAYSAAKAGVLQLTSVLALELGRYNINVNAVSPGVTVTPLVQQLLKAHPDLLSGQLKAVPLKKAGKPRAADPEEQANAVLFLVSPESDYISGQEIMVDGGSHNLPAGWTSALEQ